MIKLDLPEKPKELTEEKEQELVKIYKETGRDVWKQHYISTALLDMSNCKCAYSEQKLNSESAYMEIEHFKHKDKYQDLVVRWGNLLPACKKCNSTKGDWDVVDKPIVNPLEDTPAEHLYIKAFRFYKKDTKGENTIEAVALNDRSHFVNRRSEIGFQIADAVDGLYEQMQMADTDRKRRNVANRLKGLLKECGPKQVYSAVLATFVLYELDIYQELKMLLKDKGMWDCELEEIELLLQSIAMPAPKKG